MAEPKNYPVISPVRAGGKEYPIGSSIPAELVDDALRASGAIDVSAAGEADAGEQAAAPQRAGGGRQKPHRE
jgi:hypothetical protein